MQYPQMVDRSKTQITNQQFFTYFSLTVKTNGLIPDTTMKVQVSE
jgi:hypothetical protein